MLKLWGRNTSSNVMKVLCLLDELALPYQRIDVGGAYGGTATPDYRAMQPLGLVPALEEPDGFSLFESNAILRYLCNAHAPASSLYPSEPRARGTVDAWLDLQQTALTQPHTVFFIGLIRTPPEKRDMAAINAAIVQAAAIWRLVDARLAAQPWLAGADFTIADIAWGVHVHRWLTLAPAGTLDQPHVTAWYERLKARPAFATHCAGPLV